MYGCLSITAVLLSLLGTLLHNSAEFDNVFMKHRLADTDSYTPNERILFLTAHPDDECMFFAPTITALTSRLKSGLDYSTEHSTTKAYPEVFSLCLSAGDADGLGDVRRDELGRSLDVLGIKSENREVIDHPDLKDNITSYWQPDVIAKILSPYVTKHKISAVLTFDHEGVSGHPNHKSLPEGVKHVLRNHSHASGHPQLKLYSLITHPVSAKYTGIAGPILAKIWLYRQLHPNEVFSRDVTPLFISGIHDYLTALRAMRQHWSQLVWFRWLYVVFSKYMWINEWVEVQVEGGGDCGP